MKNIIKHILLAGLSFMLMFGGIQNISAEEEQKYLTLRTIDLGTFNEYRYRLTEQFFELREHHAVHGTLNVTVLKKMVVLADTGYKYLPDNLKNKNYLSEFFLHVKKGLNSPADKVIYSDIIKALGDYLESVQIEQIQGSIEASPITGNAPLTVTLRGSVKDPTGSKIYSGNYTWWVDEKGKRKIIGRGVSVNYTFKNEGKFSVFLDVTSSHRNKEGYTDVIPFRSKVDIDVNEKIASLIIKVNSDRVNDNDDLKFVPEDASYGLLFDATSSTPTSGTRFSRTEWDFGNGVTRSYPGDPKIERVRYGREGDYTVTLKLRTNEGKTITKNFTIAIHDPIAKISVNRQDGFIGDKFTFTAKSSGRERDLTYNWEIIDIENDKIIHQKSNKNFTYTFTDKGRYNVRLKVRQSSGEVDMDTRIIYVTSQAPIAEYESKIPFSYKPNKVYLDATRSFDPDFSDDGKLTYNWFIDGNRVKLLNPNRNNSIGYFDFDSIGTHSVNLEVTDPDGIMTVKKGTVKIDSILSVEMYAYPRVIQRNQFIRFESKSPEAEVYEWDFGDGEQKGGRLDSVKHTYEKSGTFKVKLKVTDSDNNVNTFTRTIYVSESEEPFAIIDASYGKIEKPLFDEKACNGEGAYTVDRVNTLTLDAKDSINIDGTQTGLEYSWKIGNSKYSTASNVSHRFDEIGCFDIKLTVKSENNGSTHKTSTKVNVRNVLPTMSSLAVQIEDPQADPLIIRVSALGATDPDGVIQSYLWYYYTDVETEPQDFRSTSTAQTAFVIPKVTGDYYFVAILKDNNEARITSEEVTGSRYFTTITGDNINTPIVKLSVDDNSTIIGEKITFTVEARNILGQDIVKDASFSWDFDGDGFYDTQSKKPTISYAYKKSGEFYAKVKVKYKGISSTRNITINVSNKLVPDFGYISIGNKYIFFDSSQGQVDSRVWDLGDGTKKQGTYFEYTYKDKASKHVVNLKITEGTKVKEVQKTVVKNIRNILKTKKGGLVTFTSPQYNEKGEIFLETYSQQVFVYLGESSDESVVYGIDYDIENDSDLNGGLDDDEDNKGTASYISGGVAEIPLNKYKQQVIRLYVKDKDGNILGSKDITIEKSYIEEESIDPDDIIFESVTESEKEKIEQLKQMLLKLPQQQKLVSLNYVKKLQENWSDSTEKTRTILDFENYIFELQLKNEDEFITLLESLLVEGQEDQSAKQITYQALINLVPKDIVCDVEGGSCYDSMLSKIEDIKHSTDVTYNKSLGKQVLEVIGGTDLMTQSQKLDFKAILTSLVYGGDVENIPDDDKKDVIDEEIEGEGEKEKSKIIGILISVVIYIAYFVVLFIVIVAGLYILHLILNKDKNITFSEFISKITTFGKEDTTPAASDNDEMEDILSDFDNTSSDILSTSDDTPSEGNDPLSQGIKTDVKKEDVVAPKKKTEEEVPDWLKGNFSTPDNTSKKIEKPIPKKEESKKEEVKSGTNNEVPDWLKGVDLNEKKSEKTPQEKKENTPKKVIQKKDIQVKEDTFDLEKDTQLPKKDEVPDWLKGSFDTPKKEEKIQKKVSEAKVPTPKKEEKKIDTSVKKEEIKTGDDGVPDWLKGSFTEEEKEKVKPVKKDITNNKKEDTKPQDIVKKQDKNVSTEDVSVPSWLKESFDTPKEDVKTEEKPKQIKKPEEEKKKEEPKNKVPSTVKKEVSENKKKEIIPKKVEEKKKDVSVGKKIGKTSNQKNIKKNGTEDNTQEKAKTDTPEKKSELWDDGMKIPDWLKADNE